MRLEVEARVARPSGFRLEAAFRCEADALAIIGPSGSGKTTLLAAIAGIEPGARVVLDGENWSGVPLHRRAVGLVPQEDLLFPNLSVRANLLHSPRADSLGDAPRALGIEHLLDRMPRHLSGGERRRAALARALLSRPRLLLLDEPFGGLDEPRRREAMSLLDHVRRRYRLPMVLVSHLAGEVIGLADWAVRLESGRLADSGPSAAVLRSSEALIDNYFTGEIAGRGRVRVDGIELAAMVPESASGRVRLACHAHDILLASEVPAGLSARNVFAATVVSTRSLGETVLVELESPRLRALVTPEAARALGIAPGARLFAVLKATSVVYLGPA
jgi:molybdate transport system ATP-binding protein